MHKRVCQNKGFCNVIRFSEDTYILEFNKKQKSDKAPFIIYADLEKIDGCKNNPENWSSTKVSEDISSGFSMSITSLFRSMENIWKITNTERLDIIAIKKRNIEVLRIA